jgi:TRAP-type C4-dicarboxylate transport system permease small subunit
VRTFIDRLLRWTLAANLGFMTSLVFVSVFFRYVLNRPLAWSEELASLLFAWLTFVGAYVGFRTRSHIRIDTLTTLLPPPVRRVIRNFVDLCVLVLLALFIWQGFTLTRTTWSLEFPAMEISRGYLYASLPIGACLMVLAILFTRRDPDAAEQKKDWV